MKSKFILIHPLDNILVCCRQAKAGEVINMGSEQLVLLEDIHLGHKVARQLLSAGDNIIKYGVSIGSALRDIHPGEHVHIHNIKSDYMPSHTREHQHENNDHQ